MLTQSEHHELNDLCEIADLLLGFDGKPWVSTKTITYDLDIDGKDIVVWIIKRITKLKHLELKASLTGSKI